MLPVQLISFSYFTFSIKACGLLKGKDSSWRTLVTWFSEKHVSKSLNSVWFILSSSLKIVLEFGKLRWLFPQSCLPYHPFIKTLLSYLCPCFLYVLKLFVWIKTSNVYITQEKPFETRHKGQQWMFIGAWCRWWQDSLLTLLRTKTDSWGFCHVFSLTRLCVYRTYRYHLFFKPMSDVQMPPMLQSSTCPHFYFWFLITCTYWTFVVNTL